jgi:hypothetical protein
MLLSRGGVHGGIESRDASQPGLHAGFDDGGQVLQPVLKALDRSALGGALAPGLGRGRR